MEIHVFKQYLFLNERDQKPDKRQVVIEQTQILGTVFLCSEFKLQNIYSRVNFWEKNVLENFLLR